MENDIILTETEIATNNLCEAIRQSKEYIRYQECLALIKNDEEVYRQVNALRKNNFNVQNGMNGRMSYDEYHNIYNSSRMLRQNNLANQFLDAELDLARLMQEINKKIISAIDFDIDFLN